MGDSGNRFTALAALAGGPRTRAELQRDPVLGAQAGESEIRDAVTDGGFTRFRRTAETPLNLVSEVRP